MNEELRRELERVGWNELYERHIPGLGRPSARGERTARSPFPDTHDSNPSFSVNIYNGLWHCFHSNRGGNYVQFRAIMDAEEFDEQGMALPDFDATERELMVEFQLVNPIDPAWIEQCQRQLWADPLVRAQLERHKPWDARVLYALNIGYDYESERFTIPIYDREGRLINCRMYRPGGQPKSFWALANFAGNFLFPHAGWRERIVLLTEGEPDALSLRSFGFSGVSGTLGAGSPVPPGGWHRGKTVYVLMDADLAGQEASQEAGRILRHDAESVRICHLPEWSGRGDKADVSDYIKHLQSQGFGFEQVQRAIIDLLNNSTPVEHPHAVFDQPATEVTFASALNSSNLNQRISFNARITARSERRYILPVVYNVVCPASGHQYCRRCPMSTEFHGNARFNHDPRAVETLKLVQATEKEQLDTIKLMHGIVKQCPDPQLFIQRAANVEHVIINSSVTEFEGGVEQVERQRREALVIVSDTEPLEDNRDYYLEGFVYPAPKTQHGLFLVDKYAASLLTHETFKLTPQLRDRLTAYQPGPRETVLQKLKAVAADLVDSVTLIKGREDLHLAYRTVYHSALAFTFCGSIVQRGWLEALIIGDTRCGKSAAYRRLAAHYGIGVLIDCKMQSAAGVLGSVVSSPSTGERFVVPGLLPQQDGRVVCFDEFHVPRWDRATSLIEVLSSTRAEGMVRITKSASASFRARVRSIWCANPGMGRLINELGCLGVEIIQRVIRQPEDIARFDFGIVVTQDDVPVDVMNQAIQPANPLFPQELAQSLLAWIYSRLPEQIQFLPDAEHKVMVVAKEMYEKYSAVIPLCEPADQRMRVAKVAVSVAGQCFSTDPTGELLIVRPEHVEAARDLFYLFYDKSAMGYDTYSRRQRETQQIRDEAAIWRLFDETLAPNAVSIAEDLLALDEFTERTFATVVPVNGLFTRTVLQLLHTNRCIRLVNHGRKESFELTTAFIAFLKHYIRERRKQ